MFYRLVSIAGDLNGLSDALEAAFLLFGAFALLVFSCLIMSIINAFLSAKRQKLIGQGEMVFNIFYIICALGLGLSGKLIPSLFLFLIMSIVSASLARKHFKKNMRREKIFNTTYIIFSVTTLIYFVLLLIFF